MSAVPQPGGSTSKGPRRIPDKEKPCHHWMRGKCPFGNKCKFRHEESDRGVQIIEKNKKPNKPGPATKLGGPAASTGSQTPILTQTTSTGSSAVDSTPKGKEKTVAAKDGNNVNGSTSEMRLCRDWKQGKCPRGDKCCFKHDMLQLPNVRVQVANQPSPIQNSQSNSSTREEELISDKIADAAEDFRLQEQNPALIQAKKNGRMVDAMKQLRAATEAREAAQRRRLALIEAENWRKEEAMERERVAREEREAALREEENRRREEAMAAERAARQREAALREEENRRREEAMAMERERAEREEREAALRAEENRRREEAMAAERAARQREAALREEETRRRKEAIAKAKEAKAKAAREAREAKKREQALKREAQRRENEARIAREMAEREAREEAERRRQRDIAAQREKEAAVVEQYLVSETSLVTCSAGFNIQHVIPGFELCRILIKNLPRNARPEEVVDIFIQQGVKRAEFLLFQVKVIGNKQEAVVLADAEHGEAISLGLDGIEFRDEVLSFSVSDNASSNAFGTAGQNIPSILVSWRIPAETIVANYHSMEEAQRKMRELDKKIWKGRRINAKMNDPPRQSGFRTLQNFVPESVKLSNCPPGSANDNEFYQFVGSYSVRALNSTASLDLQESFTRIRQRIATLRGVKINTYQVLKRGDQVDGEVKVKVEFDDWEVAKWAQVAIDKQLIGFGSAFFQCWLPKQLQYKIMIPRQQYESQKKQWDALGEKKGVDDPYVQARIGDRGDVFIEIIGKEKKTAGPLKVRVENMIAGERLDPTFWHPSFASPRSRAFFDRIYGGKKVFVQSDFKTQSLRVYGESNAVEEARQMIKGEVGRLGQMDTTRVLNREWVGFFVREGVGKLAELLGEENVKLDVQPRMCRIIIKGGEEANHYLQRLIDQARAAVIVDSVLPGAGEAETCPVCYGDLSHPEQLGCGHSYCSGCLKHFLTSAVDNKTFPLLCVGNEATCNVPVAIPFIRRFLPQQTFSNLIEAAFHAYLEQHQRELKYCTTPDCKQIYRRRTDKTALQCPACFSTICPSCDEEAHAGMTCEEQRIHKNPAEQERLNEELATSSGYKRCPTCRAMIEKTEGCNHMTCRCGAHICWRCMNVFETPQETYDHLRTMHGGIYEEAPAGVVDGGAWDQNFLAGQVDALARIERERLAREAALRRPVIAAANHFVGPHAVHRAQPVAERIRRENALAEIQAWRARTGAWEEQPERLERVAADAQDAARRVQVANAQELARRAAELNRQNLEGYQAREAEARRLRLQREAAPRQEEDRGWCILM